MEPSGSLVVVQPEAGGPAGPLLAPLRQLQPFALQALGLGGSLLLLLVCCRKRGAKGKDGAAPKLVPNRKAEEAPPEPRRGELLRPRLDSGPKGYRETDCCTDVDVLSCCTSRNNISSKSFDARVLDCKYGMPRSELYETQHVVLEEDLDSLLGAALPSSVDREMVRSRLEALERKAASLQGSGWVQPSDRRVLLKFLVARNFHVDRAYDMLHSSLQWRGESGASQALAVWDKEPHEVLDRYWKACGILGCDRDGDPVLWERMGLTDPPTLGQLPEDWVLRHEVYFMECVMAAMARSRQSHAAAGRSGGYNLTIVMDLYGLNSKHLNRRLLRTFGKTCRIGADHYPEIVKRILVVRAPWIFPLIWSIVQHFLDKGTREKVVVVSEQETTRAILQHVPAANTPMALGGQLCLDDDPWCECVVAKGGPVPPEVLRRYFGGPAPRS